MTERENKRRSVAGLILQGRRFTEALETVIDQELGIDIVNLGLIYRVDLNEEGHLPLDSTTAMGCP